jgi:hypothetical protein
VSIRDRAAEPLARGVFRPSGRGRITPIRRHADTPLRSSVAELNRQRVSVEFLLVPVRVNQRYGTGGVELSDLIGR